VENSLAASSRGGGSGGGSDRENAVAGKDKSGIFKMFFGPTSDAQATDAGHASSSSKKIVPTSFSPVKVVLVQGEEDITIKVSDEGGGIPHSAIPRIWSYLYSSSPKSISESIDAVRETSGKGSPKTADSDTLGVTDDGSPKTIDYLDASLCGFGHGLPASRQYARLFGGDLDLISLEGYGTDTFIHLHKQDTILENIPEMIEAPFAFNKERN
jgi:signal transduction histidine kinase